jgi:hypothetical protein
MAVLALAATCASSASAAILVFTDQFLYNIYSNSYTHAAENFDSYSGNFTGGVAGVSGQVNWSATATSGVAVIGGRLSASSPEPLTLSFSGSASVYGLGGNIFGTDAVGAAVPSLVFIMLNDGTSYTNLIDSSNAFVGFISTGAAINSMRVSAQSLPGGSTSVYPTLDNMDFAYVPAPGALALMGLAGLAGSRRRR